MKVLSTRRAARTVAGIVAVSALMLAMAMPAFASHVDPQPIDIEKGAGQPDCVELGYDGGFNIDNPGADDDDTYGAPDFSVDVDFSGNDDGQPTALAFSNADPLVNAVFVKGGQDGNLYDYGAGTATDSGLEAPDGKGISHVLFCYNEPEESLPEQSEPEQSQPEQSQPEQSQPEQSQPEQSEPEATPLGEEPTPEVSEGVLGGTPTPAPGGNVPDTAAQQSTGVPATTLSLLLLASLGALLYVRLAQDPSRKG